MDSSDELAEICDSTLQWIYGNYGKIMTSPVLRFKSVLRVCKYKPFKSQVSFNTKLLGNCEDYCCSFTINLKKKSRVSIHKLSRMLCFKGSVPPKSVIPEGGHNGYIYFWNKCGL